MSCAVAVRDTAAQPFKFPCDSDLAPVALTRSQITHGSDIGQPESMWTRNPVSSGIEELKYLARQNAIEYVGLVYETDDHFAVKDFLSKYPSLVELLVEAYPRLRNAFGASGKLSLELLEDTESSRDLELFGIAKTAVSVEQGISALESFDSSWWLEASSRAGGKLNFTVEYL